MMRHQLVWTALILVAISLVACDREEAEEAQDSDQRQQATAEEEEEQVSATPQDREGGHSPNQPVPIEDFHSGISEAFCVAYDHCKNEQLKGALMMNMMTSLGMVAIQEQDRQTHAQLQEIAHAMRGEQRSSVTRQECTTVMDLVFGRGGMDADAVKAAIDRGTTTYSPTMAARCLAKFAEPFDLCEMETTPTAQPNLEQIGAMIVEQQENLDEHFFICHAVFEGQGEIGDSCRHGFECEKGSCDVGPGAVEGTCADPGSATGLTADLFSGMQ